MRLGGKMHDGIMAQHHAFQQLAIADVAHHKMDPLGRQPLDIAHVGGIRELVKHRHADTWRMIHNITNKRATAKPAATCY